MLTDEELSTLLSGAYADATEDLHAPTGLATTVRRRHVVAARRRGAVRLGVPVVAVAAVAGTLATTAGAHHGPARPPQIALGSPDSTSNSPVGTIRLAGFTFTLPAAFHAQPGTCTVRLADGNARQGTPGADGSCAAIWTAAQPPSSSPDWLHGAPGSAMASLHDGLLTVLVHLGVKSGGGYVIVTAAAPSGSGLTMSQVEAMLNDGLRAGQGH